MQSKRDQAQAHSFIMGRLTSGMLLADPDAAESPLGRTTRGTVIGLVIAVLVAAGAVVFGLISPGGKDSWRSGDSLIVNKETGARYLFIDGRLRPVRNYASALLIGGGKLKTTTVGTASLRGTPVGATVGIPGAPDSVPAAGDLEGGAWQVCAAVAARSGGDGTARTEAVTALVTGGPATGTPLGAGSAVVVRGPDGTTYLVWQGSRLELDRASGAAVSLGYGSVTPRPVSAAFLDALVAGPDLAAPRVAGLGDGGPELGGTATRLGQVFTVRVPGSGVQYYQLRSEGLVPLTSTGAALVLGDPATREKAYDGGSPDPRRIGADVLGDRQAPATKGKDVSVPGLPDTPPKAAAVPEDSAVCARVVTDSDGTRVTSAVVPAADLGPVAQGTSDRAVAACLPVDAVVARPGHGVLVRALGAGGGIVGNTTYLVGDDGIKYRVASDAALSALGYADVTAQTLPSPLLAMLATGPDLAPEAASGASAPVTAPACGTDKGGENGKGKAGDGADGRQAAGSARSVAFATTGAAH
ncbi:type VII secretion protein EccB [uncultured Streptomyces sp.]|uniref:type VII secretion protein EccB n=1 Tax=uncultured Streptomyces sp. TaxID=174707 RepID=UPI00261D121F|nr:type VII secretion protein EccB [uncultured Streptomyces sp.]